MNLIRTPPLILTRSFRSIAVHMMSYNYRSRCLISASYSRNQEIGLGSRLLKLPSNNRQHGKKNGNSFRLRHYNRSCNHLAHSTNHIHEIRNQIKLITPTLNIASKLLFALFAWVCMHGLQVCEGLICCSNTREFTVAIVSVVRKIIIIYWSNTVDHFAGNWVEIT